MANQETENLETQSSICIDDTEERTLTDPSQLLHTKVSFRENKIVRTPNSSLSPQKLLARRVFRTEKKNHSKFDLP